MPKINPQRLLNDLDTLRDFGRCDPGVVRPSLSPVDMEARVWLRRQMEQVGLDASIDGVGNVFGRSRNPGKALLIGSHSDTQPRGGWLDGALGTIYGLEVARACAEDGETSKLPVDTVAWIDEEGTYLSCLGSRAYCGLLSDEEIAAARSQEGKTLKEALRDAGLDGVAEKVDTNRYRGFVEAHIEQGGNLEHDQKKIGVVTAIVGSRNFTVRFSGQQNHAGTTPMHLRKDAGAALIDFAYKVQQAFQKIAGPRTVWTIGRVAFDPGAASIIPGKAEMHLQFRDPELSRLQEFEDKAREAVEQANQAGSVQVSLDYSGKPIIPADMDASLKKHIEAAAETHAAGLWQSMPSSAIHDAMHLAQVMPAAMLFIPSIGGISHDFAEDTAHEDIVLGCQVMTTAVASILKS